MTTSSIPRRHFLRGTGSLLALPWLESIARADAAPESPRRMIAICSDLGMIPDYFFPQQDGKDYESSRYLDLLSSHRENLTVFSGLSHPECNGGHQTDKCFLTGATHPRKPGFRNSISIDQLAAQHLGFVTRFPSLSFRVGPGGGSLSYSADGVRIPAEDRPSEIYRRLFVQGSPEEIQRQVTRLRDGQSLMDSFSGRIKSLEKKVGARDRERLDQYFTAFRELEGRLVENEEWEQKPKPEVDAKMPQDVRSPEALVARTRLIYDLARLAIETDSTRLITIFVTQQFNPKVDLPGVELPHHALTHQMSVKDSREQLAKVETAQFKELNQLLTGLNQRSEAGDSLLDRTMVLYGSNLGNAARHDTANLPVLLAGGGFKHGRHLAFDAKHNKPLSNLYLTMLHRLGLETPRFATSDGELSELILS